MRLLFLGPSSGTSGQRLGAMRRLGHDVTAVNPDDFAPRRGVALRVNYELGGLLWQGRVSKQVLAALEGKSFDCVWVDGGRNVGPGLIRALRGRYGPVVNHNVDNPFARRDRWAWLLFRKSVPFYDLVAVVRRENLDDARRSGAKRTTFHFRTADEVAHAPRELTDHERASWSSEVVFVGTAFAREGRGRFIEQLLERNVPISVIGPRWERVPEWPRIQRCWRGPGTHVDAEYSGMLLGAKVCLCLLSSGNHDLHTTRTAEIPALGKVLLAPRTRDHQELFAEWEEAVFFDGADECAEACRRLLADDWLRKRIALQGRAKCKALGLYNEPFARAVLEELLAPSSAAA